MTLEDKKNSLKNFFCRQKNILIAYSGGVDSSLLASFAIEIPHLKALAVTFQSELVSEREIEEAKKAALDIGISHIVLNQKLLNIPDIQNNRKNRCYVCKKEMFRQLLIFAEVNGYDIILEGTNYSDIGMEGTNYSDAGVDKTNKNKVLRPGFFALEELKQEQKKKKTGSPMIVSPLADLKITKEEIRNLAAEKKLKAAHKPSMSCLATRFSYETLLTPETLKMVADAEKMLIDIGFTQVRIRCHTDLEKRKIARIEVEKSEYSLFLDNKNKKQINAFVLFLKQGGLTYLTVDLEGFRSGSMDLMG
jgi:uncharacterized protein